MAVLVEATTSRRAGRFVNVLLILIIIHTVAVVGGILRRSATDDHRMVLHWRERRTPGAIRDGPPVKPKHFRSVAELNKYLADLNEYYTVLGRPRLAVPVHVINFSGIQYRGLPPAVSDKQEQHKLSNCSE